MLEYFSYQKFKKHREAKQAGAEEVLTPKDEKYFEDMVENPQTQEVPLSDDGEKTPASSASPTASGKTTPATGSETSAQAKRASWRDTVTPWKDSVTDYASGTYERAKTIKMDDVTSRLPSMPAFMHKKDSPDGEKKDKGKGKKTSKEDEEYYANLTDEERELHDALDRLNLAAQDGKAFSLSADTRQLLNRFTQILKDMINGVPTAYDDLIELFETKSKQIEKLFESTPGFLKKLVKQIPLGLGADGKGVSNEGAGIAAQAATLTLPTLKQLVTKPGAVANALKTVTNAIKLRFPGIALGTNVILSIALFVLLFVFWYCYKRGKEVRLEKERLEQESLESRETEAVLSGAPSVPTSEPVTSTSTGAEMLEASQNTTTGVPTAASAEVQHSTAPGVTAVPKETNYKELF